MKTHLANFLKYKDLLIELIKKDVKIKYHHSILGVLWSMINPVLTMIVLTIVFSAIFKNEIANFPVYVLIGRLVYSFFSESTNFAMDSIHANGQLIRKVYVPKYFFPLSRICSSFITNFVALIPLFAIMQVTGIGFSFVNFLVIFPLLYVFFISLGIGLLLATVNVFFRDMKHLYSIALMIIMYTSAIFYPASIIPDKYMPIIQLNPIFHVIEMFRDVLMYAAVPAITDHLLCIGYGFFCFVVGLFTFYKFQNRFIFHL